jgi:DNA modification methylase
MIPTCEILIGDVRAKLRELRDRGMKAKCIVTSPPYWALRDYGTEPQVWGADPACTHEWGAEGSLHRGGPQGSTGDRSTRDTSAQNATADVNTGAFCQHCGAWRGQLGLEPTPELFVAHTVEVFDLVWDVLADDGTLWMNFGDSYNGSGLSGGTKAMENGTLSFRGAIGAGRVKAGGLKPKDLVGMPWRVAFALQASGWYLRQEIIWHKPNPMPESIADRCTKAHEHLFLLTKSARYYFDSEAIKEPTTGNAHTRGDGVHKKVKMPDGWDTGAGGHGSFHRNGREKGQTRPKQNASFSAAVKDVVEVRNKRSVWTIPTAPYSEAHYATFPPDLVRPCILAGSAPGDLVMDIFGGSGTVGEVALEYGRNVVLIDLNPANEALMRGRMAKHAGQGVLTLEANHA